ncbi:MAG: ABC transporter permease [Saprospiraceae bacterium]|nr:MAG: ABC transporter permease [Saprospiraceae bacterium]
MWRNYLKVALRSLFKQKGLTFINILGLSIGMACFSLFLLYAINEFSYDRWHDRHEDIYRVYRWTESINGREANGDSYLPMILGPTMKEEIPDVEEVVRMRGPWSENFVRNGNQVSRQYLSFADPTFFKVFSFPLKYGSAETALSDLQSLVLTEKLAWELFGEANPTGKILDIKIEDEFVPFTVSAIAEDLPANSSILFEMMGNFEYFASSTSSGKRFQNNWNRSAFQTYLKVQTGSGLPTAHDRLLSFRQAHYPDEEKNLRENGRWEGEGAPVTYKLQNLRDMHTDISLRGGEVAPVDPQTIWILLAIAAAVLLIAIINFTTLSIGRSAGRAKEVGVRKVVGSSRRQLVGQFMVEALVMSVISAGIALAMAQVLLPYFNQMADRELIMSLEQYPELSWFFVSTTLVTGLLAGSYPSLMMSGFKPVTVLKSRIKLGGENAFTKSLVTLQFVLSIALISGTLIILKQLNHLQTRYPGFDKEQVIIVEGDGVNTAEVWPRLKKSLAAMPAVVGYSGAELGFGEGMGWSRSGFDYKGENKQVYEYFVDDNFLPVMKMELLAGRNFDSNITSDTVTAVIANEAMVRNFGWTIDEAVGQPLTGYTENTERTPVVIGVVKDFNYRSFHQEVDPQMFHQFHDYQPYKFFIRLQANAQAAALADIEKAWSEIVPDLPLQYSFLDENLNRFYRSEARWSNIIGWAGALSIFLACLGLLGLAALAAANRTQEIGIRKVLGATVTNIMTLISKGFMKLVLIAILIASPLAWYFTSKWLENFAYRIDIPWWVFLLAGGAAIGIAFLTISFQSIRAALANPVKSLRIE